MRTELLKTGVFFSLTLLLASAELMAQPMMPSMGPNRIPGGGGFGPPQLAPVYAPESSLMGMNLPGQPGMPPGMPMQFAAGPGGMAPPMMAMNSPTSPAAPPALLPEQGPATYPAGPIAYPDQDGAVQVEGGGQAVCSDCGGAGGGVGGAYNDGHWARPYADHDPILGLYGFSEVASWRGITNGDFPGNNGVATGLNTAAPLPFLGQYGFGAQLGGSYGAYNFSGKPAVGSGNNETEQQMFMTGGIYRRADCDRRVSGGAVYDIMWNDNFGGFNAAPTLTQFRGQIAYALGYWNEIGIWATHRDRGSVNNVSIPGQLLQVPQYFRAISQANVFWHHKWGLGGADSTLYVGITDRYRLADPSFPNGTGNLGSYIFGANINAPLNNSLALYANGTYVRPTAPLVQEPFGAEASFWNVAIGLSYYPGRGARSSTVAGRSAMPYLPVANNGSFLVNTNMTR